jgi:hypothetical protein
MLHDEERPAVHLAHVVEGADVRVIQRRVVCAARANLGDRLGLSMGSIDPLRSIQTSCEGSPESCTTASVPSDAMVGFQPPGASRNGSSLPVIG